MKKVKTLIFTAALLVGGFTSVSGATSTSASVLDGPTIGTNKLVCTMPCNKEF